MDLASLKATTDTQRTQADLNTANTQFSAAQKVNTDQRTSESQTNQELTREQVKTERIRQDEVRARAQVMKNNAEVSNATKDAKKNTEPLRQYIDTAGSALDAATSAFSIGRRPRSSWLPQKYQSSAPKEVPLTETQRLERAGRKGIEVDE